MNTLTPESISWQQIGPYVLECSHGYRICKCYVVGLPSYRASFEGSFIGPPVARLELAKAQVQQHMQHRVNG